MNKNPQNVLPQNVLLNKNPQNVRLVNTFINFSKLFTTFLYMYF